MKTVLDNGVLIVTIVMMVAVGLELVGERGGRFGARSVPFLLWALLIQSVCLPFVGFGVFRILGLHGELGAGLLLVAACPIGDIVNVYTLLARGNLKFSLSLNVLSCLLAVVSMPLVYRLYALLLGEPFAMAVPAVTLVVRLLLIVAVPITAGAMMRRYTPGFAVAITPWTRRVAGIGIAVMVALVAASRWESLLKQIVPASLAGLLFVGGALLAGYLTATASPLDRSERVSWMLSFPVRNVAIASTIAIALMDRLEYAAFIVVYFVIEVAVLLVVSAVIGKR